MFIKVDNDDTDIHYNNYTETTEDKASHILIPYTHYSDYSGSSVEMSNYQELVSLYWDDYDFLIKIIGSYDSHGLAININRLKESDVYDEVMDIIRALDNYPVINDEALSEIEFNLQQEAWESWAESDFINEVESYYPEYDFNWDGKSYELFRTMMDRANEYWESTYNSMYIDVIKIASKVTATDIESVIIRYKVNYNDMGRITEYFNIEEEASDRVDVLRENGFIGAYYD